MDLGVLRAFFGWCTVINGGFLIFTFLFSAKAADWVYGRHVKWFPIDRKSFDLVMYCFIGAMKIVFVMLNLAPYIALVILT